ncbi:hypothetical protein NDU88_003836 [Pleurodeles waltl]|uniref:Uncharacterized protein n=1 Tax=Pleurodeles waltl TaxID=8319 RepID=A0AAV7RE27_PLEWA|nr:hypothetical protein NDU88_003836 [Pleurodeles waltl]
MAGDFTCVLAGTQDRSPPRLGTKPNMMMALAQARGQGDRTTVDEVPLGGKRKVPQNPWFWCKKSIMDRRLFFGLPIRKVP